MLSKFTNVVTHKSDSADLKQENLELGAVAHSIYVTRHRPRREMFINIACLPGLKFL